MSKSIGIAGAGLAGRLLAFELAERGWQVTLFDQGSVDATRCTTYASAGMLSPSCELEKAETEISLFGLQSLPLWDALLERLDGNVFHLKRGSLVVAHARDQHELRNLRHKVELKSPSADVVQFVTGQKIAELEPGLAGRFQSGLFFPQEAQIDNRDALAALGRSLVRQGVTWHEHVEVTAVKPHAIGTAQGEKRFDWVADCRGLGARPDLKDLRGVRGELLYVSAPEVDLTRPVRLMHPRYPIYIVPRANHVYLIGATTIESDDLGPITVRSMLELLSAAYTVHTGFAEARLLETVTHCRPAFPDNKPRIYYADGLLRVNGLYRHGFLIAPSLIKFACAYLERGEIDPDGATVMKAGEA